MTGPRIGGPSSDHRATCDYAHNPDSPACGKPATTHVRTTSPHHGEVSLLTCDQHLPIAHAAGVFRQLHLIGLWCGLPSTRWMTAENMCVLDAEEPQRAGYALAENGANE